MVKGDVVGVLKWENTVSPEGFSEDDFDLAKKLAPFIAIALKAMNAREDYEKHRQETLKNLTLALLSPFEPRKLYQQIVDKTAELLEADLCSMWLCSNDRKELRLAASHGVKSDEEKTPRYVLNWNARSDNEIKGLTAWIAIRKTKYFARYFKDLEKHPAHRGAWDVAQWENEPQKQFGSLYAVPLIVDNQVHGVLKIERKQNKPPFSDVDRATFDVMADFIELALDLSNRLRQDIVFDFFHLLREPSSNCLMSFSALRAELNRPDGPRSDRINNRLQELANNLESIRGWTGNVYALASGKVSGQIDETRGVSLYTLIESSIIEIDYAISGFNYDIPMAASHYHILLTPLEEKKMNVVLFNILHNSIKFSGNSRNITFLISESDGILKLSIKDKGQGIPEEELAYVFDAYFKRSVKKWPESMGLGLTTVDRLLREFNWSKDLKSSSTDGTEFIIFIPKERWEHHGNIR